MTMRLSVFPLLSLALRIILPLPLSLSFSRFLFSNPDDNEFRSRFPFVSRQDEFDERNRDGFSPARKQFNDDDLYGDLPGDCDGCCAPDHPEERKTDLELLTCARFAVRRKSFEFLPNGQEFARSRRPTDVNIGISI